MPASIAPMATASSPSKFRLQVKSSWIGQPKFGFGALHLEDTHGSSDLGPELEAHTFDRRCLYILDAPRLRCISVVPGCTHVFRFSVN